MVVAVPAELPKRGFGDDALEEQDEGVDGVARVYVEGLVRGIWQKDEIFSSHVLRDCI